MVVLLLLLLKWRHAEKHSFICYFKDEFSVFEMLSKLGLGFEILGTFVFAGH